MKLANFSNNTVLWQQTCGKESEGIFPITVGDSTPVFMSIESNGSCTTCTIFPLMKEFPNCPAGFSTTVGFFPISPPDSQIPLGSHKNKQVSIIYFTL